MAIKTGKRELIDTGTDKRFVKRDREGKFKESVDVARSLAADRRSKSKTIAKPGYGDQGDQPKRTTKKAAKKTAKKAGEKSRKKVAADIMPSAVFPMPATKFGAPFSRPGWLFEPKWDGYRAICFFRDGQVRFVSRNQRDLSRRFPELQIIAKSIKALSAIIDGEIVAVDENGAQCFEQLQNHKRDCVIIYFAFDLLFLDGESLTETPLIERKAQLKRILPKGMAGRLRFTDHVIDKGLDLFAALEAQQLEGMVAKRAESLYVPGRSKDWLKVKTRAGMEQMRSRIESWGHR